MWKQALVTCGALGALGVGSPAAWADAPTTTTDSSGGTIVHPFLGAACQQIGISVDPIITYHSVETITTFTDAGGVTRVQYRGTSTGVITEESTGKSVTFSSTLNSVDDMVSGESALVGVRTRYSTPGEGTLLLSAGRTMFTESGADTVGRNDRGEPEAFRDVCTYLASP